MMTFWKFTDCIYVPPECAVGLDEKDTLFQSLLRKKKLVEIRPSRFRRKMSLTTENQPRVARCFFIEGANAKKTHRRLVQKCGAEAVYRITMYRLLAKFLEENYISEHTCPCRQKTAIPDHKLGNCHTKTEHDRNIEMDSLWLESRTAVTAWGLFQ